MQKTQIVRIMNVKMNGAFCISFPYPACSQTPFGNTITSKLRFACTYNIRTRIRSWFSSKQSFFTITFPNRVWERVESLSFPVTFNIVHGAPPSSSFPYPSINEKKDTSCHYSNDDPWFFRLSNAQVTFMSFCHFHFQSFDYFGLFNVFIL